MDKRWQAGDAVVLRNRPKSLSFRGFDVFTGDRTLSVAGFPYLVVKDAEDVSVLYLPEGATTRRWNLDEQRSRAPGGTTRGYSLRFLFPDKPYEVTLFFDGGSGVSSFVEGYFGPSDGHFRGWKVDIETPFLRTDLGFDVIDELLDIVVKPDRSWHWKDEEQLSILVEAGVYTGAYAEKIRQAGRDVIPLIEGGQSPFDDEWTAWRPLPGLRIPELPDGWQFLPIPDPLNHSPDGR